MSTPPQPLTDLTLVSAPRCSLAIFSAVLAAYGSPAAMFAADLYAILVGYGLDPAVALAFFVHESSCGTAGIAQRTLGWGNVRPAALACVGKKSRRTGVINNFAAYASWADGLHDWAAYILCRYVLRNLETVRQIIPIYAPTSDRNNPDAYINAVLTNVARWQAESAAHADPWASWGTTAPLVKEHAIPRRWVREGDMGPALTPEVYRPDGSASLQWFAGGLIIWLGGDRTEVVRG